MEPSNNPVVYTIGHSNHRMVDFIATLQSFAIKGLADIRRLPGSRKFPQFDQENLEIVLAENGIHYQYISALGGRRKVQKESKNGRWRNESFRGYADYMETNEFKEAIIQLEALALRQPTAYMCRGGLVAVPPFHGIGLPEGQGLEGLAHYVCRKSTRTPLYLGGTHRGQSSCLLR